jgi:hypothetical protein
MHAEIDSSEGEYKRAYSQRRQAEGRQVYDSENGYGAVYEEEENGVSSDDGSSSSEDLDSQELETLMK